MKRFFAQSMIVAAVAFCLAASCVFALSGCSTTSNKSADDKLNIVCSIFPAYDFAKQVARDAANVTLLLPPGSDVHSFEPTPLDIAETNDADVFVYMGEVSEPWAQNIVDSLDSDVLVIDLSQGIEKLEDDDGDHEHEYDPHMWLDLSRSAQMVENLAIDLSKLDSSRANMFEQNAEAYEQKLLTIDTKFEKLFSSSSTKTLVFAGRFAYVYFLERYGLDAVTVYDSCSDESEPSVKQIADVIDYINDNNVRYVYYEELTTPRVAEAIEHECNVEALQFSIGHNVTQEQFDSGITFADIMQSNYENIAKGIS